MVWLFYGMNGYDLTATEDERVHLPIGPPWSSASNRWLSAKPGQWAGDRDGDPADTGVSDAVTSFGGMTWQRVKVAPNPGPIRSDIGARSLRVGPEERTGGAIHS